MEYLLGTLGVAIILFASTNVDDIFVMLGFFADPKFRPREVVVGQYLGVAALYGASVLASLLSLVVPAAYMGLLGLAPIFLGLKKLWALRQGAEADDNLEDHEKASAGHGKIAAVAAVTIANGGDNIGIYTPVFATRTIDQIAIVGIVFALLTALWLGAAHFLVNHRTIGAPIRRFGHWIVPFILVGLGILILHEAGTIEFLSRLL
ncbi:cadmium resistance transporter [Rhizobium calliandrae]|uniref:Cadmium resistance transporter n=1 Tax=Rhizobium calliandrae TaxID=1312182 RepID=A0ABT7KKV0_9HYPH|nr:cadmium resistance transporter [Rhizobium calliandrae]MDL2408782.1 cadmium resistance transporter [Rhizobium calliandrae]